MEKQTVEPVEKKTVTQWIFLILGLVGAVGLLGILCVETFKVLSEIAQRLWSYGWEVRAVMLCMVFAMIGVCITLNTIRNRDADDQDEHKPEA